MGKIEYSDLFGGDINQKLAKTNKLIQEIDKNLEEFYNMAKANRVQFPSQETLDALKKYNSSVDKSGVALKKAGVQLNAAEKNQKALNDARQVTQSLLKTEGESVNFLTAKLKQLNIQYKQSNKETEKSEVQQAALARKIKETSAQLETQSKALKKTNTQVKIANNSYKELNERQKRVNTLLKTGANLFDKQGNMIASTAKRTKFLTAESVRLNAVLKRIDASVGQNFRSVGNYSKALQGVGSKMTAVASSAGLFLSGTVLLGQAIRATISSNIAFEESLTDVIRTTGLTNDQVRKLAGGLAKIDTRTSVKNLLKIAEAGGRLNVEGKELEGFVKVIDQVVVALSDDLKTDDAEEIATTFARIADNFGEFNKEGADTEEGIRRVATVVNELSANTKASADFILDFQKRLTGLGRAGIATSDEIAAVGATAQELGLTSEVASSAIQRFANRATRNIDAFAKISGKSVEEFSETLNTDFVGALQLVLKGVNKGEASFTDLNDALESVGIRQVQSLRTFTALAKGTDLLSDNLARAHEEYENGNSILEEYNTKSKTAAASFEKLNKEMTRFVNSEGAQSFFKAVGDLAGNSLKIINDASTTTEAFTRFAAIYGSALVGNVGAIQDYTDAMLKLDKVQAKMVQDKNEERLGEANQLFRAAVFEGTFTFEAFAASAEGAMNSFNLPLMEDVKMLFTEFNKEVEDTSEEFDALTEAEREQNSELEKTLAGIAALPPELGDLRAAMKEAEREMKDFAAAQKELDDTDFSGYLPDEEVSFEDQLVAMKNLEELEAQSLTKRLKRQREFTASIATNTQLSEDEKLEAFKVSTEKEAELVQERNDNVKAVALAGVQAAQQLFNTVMDMQLAQLDQQIDSLQLSRDIELERAEGDAEAMEFINEKFDKKQKKLNEEKARKQKNAAIINSIVNTAIAVTSALTAGPPLGIILAGIVGTLGAAQTAIIAAQPIPEFAVGTKNAPGGLAIVGEEGSELIATPTGDVMMSPERASIVNLPKGSQVFTAQETDMMKRQSLDTMAQTGEAEHYVREVVQQPLDFNAIGELIGERIYEGLKDQPQYISSINKRGVDAFMKHKGNVTKYYNERYR